MRLCNCICFEVGNKCDDPDRRAVPTADGRRLAETMNIRFYETSAKENVNVEEVHYYFSNGVPIFKLDDLFTC